MDTINTLPTLGDQLSDQLHRALAASPAEGSCLLLLDASMHPPEEDEPYASWFAEHPPLHVKLPHPKIDPSIYPVLVALDSQRAADGGCLRDSISDALEELAPENLDQGLGRRVGGWIVSRQSSQTVSQHLTATLLQHPTPGHTSILRLQDPAVLWSFIPRLNETQLNELLGPIDAWWYLDPLGHLSVLENTAAQPLDTALQLTPENWRDVEGIGPINRALRRWLKLEQHNESLPTVLDNAWQALRRAQGLGFNDPDDLSAFVEYALLIHPRFYEHPTLKPRLERHPAGQYFTAIIDPLSDDDWQRIQHDLAHANPLVKAQSR